jgi:hypothetical protein
MFNDSYLGTKYLDIKEMQKRTGLFASELLSSLIGSGIGIPIEQCARTWSV